MISVAEIAGVENASRLTYRALRVQASQAVAENPVSLDVLTDLIDRFGPC